MRPHMKLRHCRERLAASDAEADPSKNTYMRDEHGAYVLHTATVILLFSTEA